MSLVSTSFEEDNVADINVERKSPSVWPWIIGLLVLALLIWALVELFEGDEEAVVTDPALEQPAMVEPAAEPALPDPMIAALPVSEIALAPGDYEGRTVSGETTVAEVVGEQGFWVEDGGERILVVYGAGAGDAPELTAGERVRITDATVVPGSDLASRGIEVDERTSQAASAEDAVLSADPAAIHIVTRGGPEIAADTAGQI